MKKFTRWLALLLIISIMTAKIDVYAESVSVESVTVVIPEVQGKLTIGWISDMHVIDDYTGHSSVTNGLNDLILRAEGFRSEGRTISYARQQWLRNAEYLSSLNPDVVILGGDIIDYFSDNNVEVLKNGLSMFNCPVMYLRADHDYEPKYVSSDDVTTRNRHSGIYADNPSANVIRIKGISIVGITDSTRQVSSEQLSVIQQEAASNKVILATHVPYASKVSDSLKQLSISKRGREYYWGSSTWSPSGATSSLISMIESGNSIPLVLCGHMHTSWDGEIVAGVRQHIFNPGYSASVGLVHISGSTQDTPDPEKPVPVPAPEPVIPDPVLPIIPEPEFPDDPRYTFNIEGRQGDPDRYKKEQIIRK